MTNVKFPRRKFLHLAAGAAALPFAPHVARAQAYPARPVRWVLGAPPGGPFDIVARLMGQWLSERLGQPFVIEHRPGAASIIATETVARAPADGYTILLVPVSMAINPSVFEKLNYNFFRDIAPVASMVRVPLVMVVNPSLPANTVPQFIASAKANPGKLSYASSGPGTSPHLAAELFKMAAGVDMLHVPYRGSAPALTDLIGGQVQVTFDILPNSIEHVRAGKLLALAVSTGSRSEALPDIPPMADFLPGFEASTWFGVGVPRSTPVEIVDRLNKEINGGLADPKIKARLADLGAMAFGGSPADFSKFIEDETEKWGKVVRAAGIKAE